MKARRARFSARSAALCAALLAAGAAAWYFLRGAPERAGDALAPDTAREVVAAPTSTAAAAGTSAINNGNRVGDFRRVAAKPRGAAVDLRTVRLVSRVLTVPTARRIVPDGFALTQSPGAARGTVPFMLVGERAVGAQLRRRVTELGARPVGYLPNNAILAEADAAAFERLCGEPEIAAVFEYESGDKMLPRFRESLAGGAAREVAIALFDAGDARRVVEWARGRGGAPRYVGSGRGGKVIAKLGAAAVAAATRLGEVRWVEESLPAQPMLDLVVAPERINARVAWEKHGLKGEGQLVVVTDTGLDTGEIETLNPDFANRILRLCASDPVTSTADKNGHGTHIAGILAGTGENSEGRYKGVAHGAQLLVWGCRDPVTGGLLIPGFHVGAMEDFFAVDGIEAWVSSASWGVHDDGEYDQSCSDLDWHIWNDPARLAVFANGNWPNKIATPGVAKNCVAVGASGREGTAEISANYSYGPAADGRIKPDVCAPGRGVMSVQSSLRGSGKYRMDEGTSMATPAVSGAAAIMRQWLMERRGFTNELPSSALLKAMLTGGATDMWKEWNSGAGTVVNTNHAPRAVAPDNYQGWGRVNIGETIEPLPRVAEDVYRAARLYDRIPFAAGETYEAQMRLAGAGPLDVQLVWMDYPGEAAALSALVNDLDLEVERVETGEVWRGNGVDGGDRTNTVESVRIDNAAPGVYKVRVIGVNVPYGAAEGGAAAVYARGAFPEAIKPMVLLFR